MSKINGLCLTASFALLFTGAASAGDNVLLALNVPAPAPVTKVAAALKADATAQAQAPAISATDFDALSSVNDPLYREGSKELLQQVIKQDSEKAAPKTQLRDAPVSREMKPLKKLKKIKTRKPVHADPLKHSAL